MELIQEAGGPIGIGAAVWMMAKVLRQGPGKLHEWAGLLPRAQAEWLNQRTTAEEQRARLEQAKKTLDRRQELVFRAHRGAINVAEATPGLRVDVVDYDGEPAAPPVSPFLN